VRAYRRGLPNSKSLEENAMNITKRLAVLLGLLMLACLLVRAQQSPQPAQQPPHTWLDDDPYFQSLGPKDQKALRDKLNHLPDKGQLWYTPPQFRDDPADPVPAQPVAAKPGCVSIPATKKQKQKSWLRKRIDAAEAKGQQKYDKQKAKVDGAVVTDSACLPPPT
jgi:hypothetical protein